MLAQLKHPCLIVKHVRRRFQGVITPPGSTGFSPGSTRDRAVSHWLELTRVSRLKIDTEEENENSLQASTYLSKYLGIVVFFVCLPFISGFTFENHIFYAHRLNLAHDSSAQPCRLRL